MYCFTWHGHVKNLNASDQWEWQNFPRMQLMGMSKASSGLSVNIDSEQETSTIDFLAMGVCGRQTTHSSATTVPMRLAKFTSLFRCIRYPTSLSVCNDFAAVYCKTLGCLYTPIYPGCYIFSIWEPRPPDTNFSVSICLSFLYSLITPSQGS